MTWRPKAAGKTPLYRRYFDFLETDKELTSGIKDEMKMRGLGWKVTPTFDPAATAEILLAACKNLGHGTLTLPADAGPENLNIAVDELIHSGLPHRVLARTEITYSNSLIESWWRVLKQQWL